MKTPLSKIALFAAMAGIGVIAAPTASATQAQNADRVTSSVTVHYGDLDLNTASGADRLYLRLDRAAETVCGGDYEYDPAYIELWGTVRRCEKNAIGRAVAQVDSPKLTTLFDDAFGKGTANGRTKAPAVAALG
jgi:UrcA family protein